MGKHTKRWVTYDTTWPAWVVAVLALIVGAYAVFALWVGIAEGDLYLLILGVPIAALALWNIPVIVRKYRKDGWR